MKLHLTYLTPLAALAMVVPDGTPGEPPSRVNVKSAAKRIDRLLELDMKRAKLQPNAVAGDATFLRRAYLGIIGRIPTVDESLKFLNSQQQDKRAKLVDALLDSPGYQSHMFNFWADLLRVKNRLNNQVSGEPFIHYLKDSIAKNKPYDKFVSEMVTASGAAHSRDNGATGLLMRDRGMPLDSMANTVRVFLGTRLECAQCHNHPFDKWKQKDFYQMAAFAGGLSYRNDLAKVPGADNVRKLYGEMRQKKDRNGMRALGRMMRQVNTGLNGSGTGVIQLPKDYQYDDAKPREVVKAHAIFGRTPKIDFKQSKKQAKPKIDYKKWRKMSARERMKARQRMAAERRRNGGRSKAKERNTRESFGEWLTSPKNDRFTKVIANRVWKHTMGRGLIEPVDNIMDKTKPSNPALMSYLEKLMVDVDYDLKQFQRVLFNTQTFQRETPTQEVPSDQKFYFQGPVLRRMTAEQVWDSMLTFVVPGVDAKLQKPDTRANFVYGQYERLINMSAEELRKEVNQQKLRYSDPKKYREQQRKQQQKVIAARRAKQREDQRQKQAQRKKAQPLYRELIKARRAKDEAKIASLKKDLLKMGIDVDAAEKRRDRGSMGSMMNRFRGRGRGGNQMVRASDLTNPAPNGHFVRKFGQSDRDQIQASHTEANVPQVLSLLNGFVDGYVVNNRGSQLMKSIGSASSSKEQVRLAYLGILNREPRGREQAVWAHEIDTQGESVLGDLVWTLVNTHEFRFVQ